MATKADVRASLEQQLKDMGADVAHFQAALDDYMFYYTMHKKMQADVKKRGLEIEAVSAAGKVYTKDNPSVKKAALYNQQMMALRKELGVTTSNCRPVDDDGGGLG